MTTRAKTIKYSVLILLVLISIGLFSTFALAESEFSPAIQSILDKINAANNDQTEDFALKISFFIAFIAGMLGILSPCILPFLPAYFSYTFKEKKNITKMTLVFAIGFSIVFVIMGVIAGFLGSQVMSIVQSGWLLTIAGTFIIFMGILSLQGKGFSSIIKHNKSVKNDVPGIFLLGVFFAIGWTACLGPILAGILGIGAILGNPLDSGVLLLFYAFGNLVPLFIISIFYDKLNLANSRFIKGKMYEFNLFGKYRKVHSTNLISGILFLFIGFIIVIFQGTGVFNAWDFLNTKQYFYSVQRQLIEWQYANIVGIIVFVIFVAGLVYFFYNGRKK